MARCAASAKWAAGPALEGQRDMPLALRLSEGLDITGALQPVAGLSRLWRYRVDLRAEHGVLFIEHCVVETIKVIQPHTEVAVWPALLIFDQQTYDSFVFKQEGLG